MAKKTKPDLFPVTAYTPAGSAIYSLVRTPYPEDLNYWKCGPLDPVGKRPTLDSYVFQDKLLCTVSHRGGYTDYRNSEHAWARLLSLTEEYEAGR